ncbi:MAG: hypothetical protein ICV84_02220 [Flavisolibacter sp.]|nr:hypothetical protein [Flavisolibacter sp.]
MKSKNARIALQDAKVIEINIDGDEPVRIVHEKVDKLLVQVLSTGAEKVKKFNTR